MKTWISSWFTAKRTISLMIVGVVFSAGIVTAFSFFSSSPANKILAGATVPFDKTHHMNIERFDRELAVNQMNEAQMKIMWKRFPYFKPMIEQKLRAAGVPTDIFI